MTDVAVIAAALVVFVAYCVGWFRGALWANLRWCDEIDDRFGNSRGVTHGNSQEAERDAGA